MTLSVAQNLTSYSEVSRELYEGDASEPRFWPTGAIHRPQLSNGLRCARTEQAENLIAVIERPAMPRPRARKLHATDAWRASAGLCRKPQNGN